VEVTGARLTIGTGGPELNGDFAFEQITKPNNAKLVKFGVANLSVTFGGQGITEAMARSSFCPQTAARRDREALRGRFRARHPSPFRASRWAAASACA